MGDGGSIPSSFAVMLSLRFVTSCSGFEVITTALVTTAFISLGQEVAYYNCIKFHIKKTTSHSNKINLTL